MATAGYRKVLSWLVIVCMSVALCGCQGLEYHDIYMAAIGGAALGAIVGHQSDECGAGAAVGAAVFAAGELLSQVDDLSEKELDEAAEEVAKGNSPLTLGH